MKLKKEFVVHRSAQEAMLVPTGAADFAGMIMGNASFGTILSLLGEDTTERDIVSAMCGLYDVMEDVVAGDVKAVLAQLREIGALEE